jgi:hypothetical protein
MPEVASLKLTNTIIYVLSLIGSLIFIFIGLLRGECVDYCDSSYAEYIASPTIIATGIAGLLISSLVFQVINVFAVHVDKSHLGR